MFVSINERSYLRMLLELIILAAAVFFLGSLLTTRAQKAKADPSAAQVGITSASRDEPLMRDYKGVQLGMTAAEARKKLGDAADKTDAQDFYLFSDTESAQVFYDAAGKVKAVSVCYVNGTGAPTPKALFGVDLEPRDDGSVYKLVKYQTAGYWIAYSRTAGDAPLVTVSMQKDK